MRSTFNVLIAFVFIAVLSVNAIYGSPQKTSTKMCLGKEMASQIQKVFITIDKGNPSESFFDESIYIDDDSFGGSDHEKFNEKSMLFNFIAVFCSALFPRVNNLVYNNQYGDPYNDVVQFPFYILHHAIKIPVA